MPRVREGFVVLGGGSAARHVAAALGGRHVVPDQLSIRERRQLWKNRHVINFGWSTRWVHINSISKANNWVKDKAKASHRMRERGINCAEYVSPVAATVLMDTGQVSELLERDSTHSRGRDIRLITRPNQIRTDKWYVKLFKKDREYRAHVVCGEVIKLQRKVPEDKTQLVWSNEHAEFERVNHQLPVYQSIERAAIDAVASLGLDFGAVDIGTKDWTKGTGPTELIVFEVNLAPALSESTAQRYAEAFRRRIEAPTATI